MPSFGSFAASDDQFGALVVAMAANAGEVDFERDVAPLLERRCLECHSEAARKGGLSLETAEAMRAGGKSGEAAIVPGDADASRLIELVTAQGDAKPRMPKGREPLSDAEIAALRAWIDEGASWPEGRLLADRSAEAEFERRRDWWSLRPIAPPKASGIDQLIRAKLREHGLEPLPSADRRTLIRRVTFDLTGLPPTPEEVAAFLADPASDGDAYERLVDRLLDSPRFGERFARRWLDLVHFGETHGFDKDKPRPNAWPYRDWLIASMNADKPWARFVQEQLAGDVLFPGDPDALVATGFIAAGPWDFVGHVELREGTTDKAITRNLDRDDMVMAAMSTFASATVHCARCHDHKFDAITQDDYYSLQAVFAGVERAEREFDRDPALATRRAELRRARDGLAAAAQPEREALGWHGAILPAAEAGDDPAAFRTQWVQLDLGEPRPIEQVILVPAHEAYGGWPGPGFGFPVRFRVEVADSPDFAAPRVLADFTREDFENPGDFPVVVDGSGDRGRFVRVTATRLWHRTGDYAFALGELVVLSDGEDVARAAVPSASDSIEAPPRWSLGNVNDGRAWLGPIDAHGEWLAWTEELARLDARLAELPPPQRVYAVASGFTPEGAFTPPVEARPIHVLARGDVKSPLSEAPPGALSCIAELPARFEIPPGADEGARRAALARWLTDPRNPLSWRSIVNRVWLWHFGEGLVATPNDFGHMGALPSHPELLDWLAARFRDGGGSLKDLHRLLVTSAAYRQVSLATPDALAADAGNRLLARMPRARLDAEQVRDSLLAIAGTLDLAMGGPSDREFAFKDDHSPVYDYARFEPAAPAPQRRGIYRFLVRSVPDPFMECLDCPDASLLAPKRGETITALQSLALLNDPFVIRQCEALAGRLQREAPGDLAAQVARAFELALARRPSSDELAAFEEHARNHGLPAACRVLVNLDEFLFVD